MLTQIEVPSLLGAVISKVRFSLFLTIGVGFLSCQSVEVYQNFQGTKPPAELAVVSFRGYRFWLVSDRKKAADEIRLTPGQYMIGFVTAAREGGAALCVLEANRVYSFRVIEKQYLPKTGTFALVGQCFFDPQREDNKPS